MTEQPTEDVMQNIGFTQIPNFMFFLSFACAFYAAIAGYVAHWASGSGIAWILWVACLGLATLAVDYFDCAVTDFLRYPAPLVQIRRLDLRRPP